MAPRDKVLCLCCDTWLSRKREAEHRRALVLPSPPPTELPSLQQPLFGPNDADFAAAGLSGVYSDVMEISEPGEGAMDVGESEDYGHFDPGASADMDEDGGLSEENSTRPSDDLQLSGLIQPELIAHEHWGSQSSDIQFEFEPDSEDEGENGVRDEDADSDNSDDEPDLFDWDSFKAPGLSAVDQLGEDFEREAAEIAHKLSSYDIAICRAFAYKVKTNTTDKAFKMTPQAFPVRPRLPKLDGIRSRINHLAGFKPQIYDCCTNSCVCFVGPHAHRDKCPYCNEPRLRANGKPRKKFTYIPIIPRLVAFASNPDNAKEQQYRAEHVHEAGLTTDVFDGRHYRSLRKKEVEINGQKLGHRYFSDPRDVALGASWDGFAPFKRRKKTCWPLILFNYNLPPELRCLLKNILALGVIPGPKKPYDSDSFLWPVIEELLQLAKGVRAYDALSGKLFALHAYLILVFGDIPAVSMFMRMKGHNGVSPCRMCKIIGLRVPNTRATTHYVPLDRSRHPDVKADPDAIAMYDPANLPMRTHDEIIQQGKEVQAATTDAEADRLSKAYGIKGVPILSYLGSLSFPQSFGYDFMHLIWENLVKNLTLLWTGDFKGLDEGRGDYELGKTVWEAVASQTAAAFDTIPSAYGSRVPNISKDRPNVSAEMWSFWTVYLGPVLLRRRFKSLKYFRHYVKLVRLLNLCLQFEISNEEIEEVRTGFIDWVNDYEKYNYQRNPSRLSTCPLTIHALLHIADGIRFCGPVWCYWAFAMERYCGSLQPGIRNPRHPWASLDRYVLEVAQLTQITTLYNLAEELTLEEPPKEVQGSFSDPLYPSCILLPPKKPTRPDEQQVNFIAAAFATRFDVDISIVRDALPDALIEEWGKVRRVDSDAGDTMRSCSLGVVAEDARDATFVRYEMLVDLNAHFPRRPEKLVKQTFYGQLTHIYRVFFSSPCAALNIEEPTTYILAAIRSCALKTDDKELSGLDIHFYTNTSTFDVIDIVAVQALVGRVPMPGNEYAIIDRSGVLARAEWIGNETSGSANSG